MEERLGAEHCGEEWHESPVEKAERMITAESKQAGWTDDQLNRESKKHPVKVRLALELRAQTTLTVREIAARLRMGTRHYAEQLPWHAARQDTR